MMTIDQILTKLDHYYKEDQLTEVEPFLLSCLEDAKKEQEYGIYISVGNELLGFYRSIGQFEAAFAVGEDVLLLMEELQLDHTVHFATTLFNVATAYRTAGKYEEALANYRRALEMWYGFVECSFMYAIALSSTGKMPFLPPASIAMLAIVNRSSMLKLATPSPVNSMDLYSAPSTPILPMICKITSLPLTHLPGLPIRLNRIADGTLNHALPVAIPAAISVLPTPVENAPSAP